jgi:hypothetical protein
MVESDPDRRSEAGRALAALRPVVSGTCSVCCTPFQGIKAGRRPKMYCSKKCSMRALRERRRAQATAEAK